MTATPIAEAIVLEFGNPEPQNTITTDTGERVPIPSDLLAPSVTELVIPHPYLHDPDLDLDAFEHELSHALLYKESITNGLDEALLTIAHPSGFWRRHSTALRPTWIASDSHPLVAELVARWYSRSDGVEVAVGRPDGLFDTHWTKLGPPGTVPGARPPLDALLLNCGRDNWAALMGGGSVGSSGTASAAPTATTMTDGTKSWTTNQWAGYTVVCGSVYGIVLSNTATVLTVDQWYAAATPGGAAGATPANGATYAILPGGMAGWFCIISTSSALPASGDTSVVGGITAATDAGGGLVPKICPYAHTAGTNTFTMTPVFTMNAADVTNVGAVTIYQAGFGKSLNTFNAATLYWKSCINFSATMAASGDQLTLTETVTGT
jgi:hypothetical protein